jgi:radical SAM superfamily enzyme YgiQ (UPF0313 family)
VHVALCPEESLVDGANYAVQGPGERPVQMILEEADPATVPGLVWRSGGQVHVNRTSPAQKLDLDDLPLPLFRLDRDWVLLKGKVRVLSRAVLRRYGGWHGFYYDLVTSRGCVYNCAYCCNVDGAPVRRSSVDRVMAELKNVRATAPWISGINIQDDSFYTGSDEWVAQFCARMKTDVDLPFIVRMIPRYVSAERLATLSDAGLEYVTMGLETSSRLNKQLFNRPETVQTFLKAARAVLDAGLLLSIDVLVDNPYETEADLREVAETLNALPRGNWGIVALSLTPFPNTPFYRRCVKDRFLDRFATDAYDAMLMPSRPDGYRTPRFWKLLITTVLPRVNAQIGARLIAAGPAHPPAVQIVERLASAITRTARITTRLRDETPLLYRLVYRCLRPFSRGRPLPSGMKIVE